MSDEVAAAVDALNEKLGGNGLTGSPNLKSKTKALS